MDMMLGESTFDLPDGVDPMTAAANVVNSKKGVQRRKSAAARDAWMQLTVVDQGTAGTRPSLGASKK